MSNFPHIYTTTAQATNEVLLKLTSGNLPTLEVSPPPEFNGPDGYWNPEAMFSAAISTCFILTFKAVSRAMKLTWQEINVDVDAYLDKADGKMRFTKADIFVTLKITDEAQSETFLKALQKAEENCLITNSLSTSTHLYPKIVT